MSEDVFCQALRSAADKAGVFEYDGETGYFYLYDVSSSRGQKVVAALRILRGPADLGCSDISIRWDATDKIVGLFIGNSLWAAFDSRDGTSYGGLYRSGSEPAMPQNIKDSFTL